MPVDIVGHSWFFKKDWLAYFVREPPQVHERISSGEDMHFAFMLQKYAHIPVYVPPHPPNDTSLWGSIPKTAWEYGCDGNSETGKFTPLDITYRQYIERGFRVMVQRYKYTMKDYFNMFLTMIRNKTPFAIIRPSDGEYYVLNNTTLTNVDNWTFTSNGRLRDDLEKSIHLSQKKGVYIGIPCDECSVPMCKWYMNKFKLNPIYTTFANIFVNGNWKNWVNFLENEKIQFTYIGSGKNDTKFSVKKSIIVDPYLVNAWDEKANEAIAQILSEIADVRGSIFMFCCGPIAKILISMAWDKNPNNIYIDAGSSLDMFFKGSSNRCYINDNDALSKLQCKFSRNGIEL